MFLLQEGSTKKDVDLVLAFIDGKSMDVNAPVEIIHFNTSQYRQLRPLTVAFDRLPSTSHAGLSISGLMSSDDRNIRYLSGYLQILRSGHAIANITLDGYY